MSKFNAFLAQNKVKHENIKYRLSADFLDEDGQPAEWELRHLGAEENEQLQRESMVKVSVPGKPGQFNQELDIGKYNLKMACCSVVSPDLNDKELQDSYGVMGAEKLLLKMLSAADYNKLTSKIVEFNGFKSINDDVEEAKN